ncbi:MAG: 2-amino-4-hydroxy-6-hydroxymethyldihydropteridine diphosphokinase [Alteromonadaceae bacterium]|uniref:2-amino-4-hydroxy-6- hydroxymethyldihydropteridine diphosphokinase n=1 Tax=Marinobacter sp. V034 TaxID=3459610 RepID=UPI000C669DFB|nr:2-amino-4-hydroxy-6-hydroxymethyldihydropteridine diphosphokinase [Alteromonadaceae bacterium]MBH85241.1 2-amino-4-hydroxy-6-hydroxymethyldihydropteridine diphosphokinase [Alteromonadaceae bacterium]|tara:strand:+ start:3567 stop:4091 length:525 start_codon:yes stop_codon:yes gene_type:complete
MPVVDVYIGLGSNLADPLRQLAGAIAALAALPETCLIAQSPFYASKPVGPQDQPDFINGATHLRTSLLPLELLDQLQNIEQHHQRERIQHWGPRTLDLDLLLFGMQTINEPRLTVPHRELANRDFVLQPLLDLAPELTLPNGDTVAELRQRCPDNQLRLLNPAPSSLATPRPED